MTDGQSPPRTTRDRRRDLTEAARRLFVARGYRDTSVSAIVAGAGVAQGTFYLYFKSKEQVLDALRGEVLRDYMGAFRAGAQPGERADARLVGGLAEIYRAVRRNRALERVFRQAASGEETAQVWLEGKKAMAGPLAQLLREGEADGSFELDDARIAAHLTLALFENLLYEALEHGTPASGRKTLTHGTRFLLGALGAPAARIEALCPLSTEK